MALGQLSHSLCCKLAVVSCVLARVHSAGNGVGVLVWWSNGWLGVVDVLGCGGGSLLRFSG